MFRLSLFRIRAFSAGNGASFLASLSRGGLMFMLIIWLQGIWLPLHGYSFSETPLWAGHLHDPADGRVAGGGAAERHAGRSLRRPAVRHGRLGPGGAQLHLAESIAGQLLLRRIRRPHVLELRRHGHVHRAEPDGDHEQPAGEPAWCRRRHGRYVQCVGPGALHRPVLQPHDPWPRLDAAVRAVPRPHRQGISPAVATRVSHLPPVGSLFAAFLGYNPMQVLLGHAELSQLPHSTAAYLTSRQYFPHLIAPAFSKGLTEAFSFAAGACLLGAVASLLRGGKYHHGDDESREDPRARGSGAGPGGRGRDRVVAGRLRWPSRRHARRSGRPLAADGTEAGIRISDAATRVGVSARTLRYYEELGLLTPSLYTPGGERRYTADDLAHLQRILELREVLGMNLDEIREFLALETRLDELRASYRATKGATSKKARARAEGDAPGGARPERVAGGADQRQAGPHGRVPSQVDQRRAALPGAPGRAGVTSPSTAQRESPDTVRKKVAYAGPVAYDEDLAQRIRVLVATERGLTEKKMFGGLAFLVGGNMAVAASGQGGILVRVGPERSEQLVATTKASVAVMRGRPMPGWLRVGADGRQDQAPTVQVGRARGRVRPVPAGEGIAHRPT